MARVLIITPDYPPPPGGIQTMVRNLERGLENLDHEPIVVHADPEGYDLSLSDIVPNQVSMAVLRSLSPQLYPYFNMIHRRTIDAIEQHDPDVVHAAHIRMWPALHAARERNLASVVSTHALELNNRRTASVAFEKATAIHAVSEFTGSLIERDHGISPDAVIHPSIDIDAYRSLSDVSDHGIGSVFTISRIVERKNIGTILDAWQKLGDGIRDNRVLEIAGTGPQYEFMLKCAESIDRVQLLGQISEDTKLHRLHNSELFILPAGGSGYDVEGFGIVYIEAQAAGTPVIGSSVGGVPEAVGNGGLLIDDVTDSDELARKIERLLTNQEIRNRCIQRAEKRIGRFDIEPIARQYVDFYHRLI